MKRVFLLCVLFSVVLGKPYHNRRYVKNLLPNKNKYEVMYNNLILPNNDFFLEDLKNVSTECKSISYKNSFCIETIPVIAKSIKNMRNHILTTADTEVLLELLGLLQDAVYDSYRNAYFKNNNTLSNDKLRNIYNVFRNIRWTGNIASNSSHLDSFLTKTGNIFVNANYLEGEDYQLEVVDYFFLHLFKWKVNSTSAYTDIIRTHFFVLKHLVYNYRGTDKTNFLYKILYNLERIQTISQKLYPEDFVEAYKLHLYVDLLNIEDFTPDIIKGSGVLLDYDVISHGSVLKKKDTFTIRNSLHCTVYHNQKNIKEVIATLRKVEEDFIDKMNINISLIENIQKDVKLYIFDSPEEYGKYNRFFNYESNNGGVTYNYEEKSLVYMYDTARGIRNLEHEFIHVIGHFYLFEVRQEDVPLFVVEGLAEAIGQDICETRIMSYNLPEDFSTIEYIFKASSYNAFASPYTVGNIVISYALKNGYSKIVKDAYVGNTNALKKMIIDDKTRLQEFAKSFVSGSKKCNRKSINNLTTSFLRKYKMDEKDVIVCIDDTYFFLYEDRIQMLVGDRKNFIFDSEFISRNATITSPGYGSDMNYFIYHTIGGIFYEYKVVNRFTIKKPMLLYKNKKLVTNDQPLFHKLYKKLYEMLIEFVDDTMVKDYDTFALVNTRRNEIIKNLKRDIVDLVTVNYDVEARIHKLLYKINSSPLITREELDEIGALEMNRVVSGLRSIKDIIEDSFALRDVYNKQITFIKRAEGVDYLSKNTIYPLRYELRFIDDKSKFRLIPGQTFKSVPDLVDERNITEQEFVTKKNNIIKEEVVTEKNNIIKEEVVTEKSITVKSKTKKKSPSMIKIDWSVFNKLELENDVSEPKKIEQSFSNDTDIYKTIESISDNVQEINKKVEDIYKILIDDKSHRHNNS